MSRWAMVVLLVMPWLGAAMGRTVDVAAIDAFVEERMERHAIPGVAIAITEGTRVVHARGFGSDGRGGEITADTPMYIGSVSKSFTALAVMQLVEAGTIDLDAPIRSYLPWFALADERAAETITVRHLLGHTSGLSDLQYLEISLPDDATIADGVRDLRRARPIDPVGTSFHYFNPGYATLGLVVEEVTGRRYGDYLREHVLEPLEMHRTFTDERSALEAGLARGHSLMFGVPIPREQPFRAYGLPAGYIVSTANDMARYLIAMNDRGRYGSERILSLPGMLSLHAPNEVSRPYAKGWVVGEHRGHVVVQHGGANEFFKAEAMLLPNDDLGVVVLINQGYLPSAFLAYPDLANGLLDLLVGAEPAPAPLSVRWMGYALAVALVVELVLIARSLRRLRSWGARTRTWSRIRKGLDIALTFTVTPAIAIAIVLAMEGFLGRGTSLWKAFDGVPDASLLLLIAFVADLGQGLYKLYAVSPSFAATPSPSAVRPESGRAGSEPS